MSTHLSTLSLRSILRDLWMKTSLQPTQSCTGSLWQEDRDSLTAAILMAFVSVSHQAYLHSGTNVYTSPAESPLCKNHHVGHNVFSMIP